MKMKAFGYTEQAHLDKWLKAIGCVMHDVTYYKKIKMLSTAINYPYDIQVSILEANGKKLDLRINCYKMTHQFTNYLIIYSI